MTDRAKGEQILHALGPLSSTSEENVETWAPGEGTHRTIRVPTNTLDAILEDAGVTRIDFLSMDIEGGEAAALRGFDIERHRPELVCIEVAPRNRDFVSAYFREHGYERLDRYRKYDRVNWYFAPVERSD